MFIAKDHVAIRALGHLTELIKTTCHDSKVASKMRFHRTKAASLIQVIASDIQSLLINKVHNNFFSIAFDETTDESTTKIMVTMLVRDIFSYSSMSPRQEFLFTAFPKFVECKSHKLLCPNHIG